MTYDFSENIQRGILYLAKSDKDFLVETSPLIKADYFEFPQHQKFWSVITDHYETYKSLPSDDAILQEVKKLKSDSELLSDYREELTALNEVNLKSIDNREYYLDSVEEFAKDNAIKGAILDSLDLLKTRKYSEIQEKVRDAITVGRQVDLGTDYFSDIDSRWARAEDEDLVPAHATPFDTLNASLEGGLCSKELAMVVAPPGVGKSLFLANQAVDSVLDGKNVLYVSLEMSEDRVSQRMDSIFTRIRQSDLKTSVDKIKERMDKLASLTEMGCLKIKEFPTKRATVNNLRAYINQMYSYHDIKFDMVIIDYLELLATDGTMPEYQAQERIAQELRGLAIENECLVWTATQTNREGRKVNIITDAELADSYGKTRVCDLVFSINQNEQEFDEGKARVYVIKSRNGRARFMFNVGIDYNTLVVQEQAG